jgi:hypothetical protein
MAHAKNIRTHSHTRARVQKSGVVASARALTLPGKVGQAAPPGHSFGSSVVNEDHVAFISMRAWSGIPPGAMAQPIP